MMSIDGPLCLKLSENISSPIHRLLQSPKPLGPIAISQAHPDQKLSMLSEGDWIVLRDKRDVGGTDGDSLGLCMFMEWWACWAQ